MRVHLWIALVGMTVMGNAADVLADGHNPTGWQVTASLPEATTDIAALAHKRWIYSLGGGPGGLNCFYAAINADGSLGSWLATTSLPSAGVGSPPPTAIVGDRVYISLANTNGDVYSSAINLDGSLGAWRQEAALPPYRALRLMLQAYKGRLYGLGGFHNGSFADTYMGDVSLVDGAVSSWTQLVDLPNAQHHTSVHFFNDRIYLVGGIANSFDILDSSYSAPINGDGTIGTWRSEATLPYALWLHGSQLIDGAIWLFGGVKNYSGSEASPNVFRSLINPADGTLGLWETMGQVPSGGYTRGPGIVQVPFLGGLTYYVGGWSFAGGATNAVWRSGSPCPWDSRGDGLVNTIDFLDLLQHWGTCSP